MLVHFIGGPAHGRTEAILSPVGDIRLPLLSKPALCVEGEIPALTGHRLETLTYKITRRTRRYCIAEFEAPKVPVDFRVTLGVDTWDADGLRAFEDVLRTWQESSIRHGNIRLLSMERYKIDEIDISFGVTVDGPADPMALADAAEQLQHFLDSRFPVSVRRSITPVGSQGSVNPQ